MIYNDKATINSITIDSPTAENNSVIILYCHRLTAKCGRLPCIFYNWCLNYI